jgi:hypothetical protein
MAKGHVCGGILPRKCLKFETRKCYFLHSEHPNLPLKFMLTILVFEIKEGKNAPKI